MIVEYRDRQLTDACVDTLRRGTFQDFSIFLIDNTPGSIQSSGSMAERFGVEGGVPRIECLSSGTNLGFCEGCNIGIRHALAIGVKYVLILNYDTLLEPDFLERMIHRAEGLPELGILGAKIYYQGSGKRLWYAGGRLSRALGVGKHSGFNETDTGIYEDFREVSYVTGCCMLVPERVFRQVGLFNADLFMYLDDAEFCLRVLDTGRKLYFEPKAVLLHRVGPGSRKAEYPDYYLYFSIRNKPWITRRPAYRLYLHLFTFALAISKFVFYATAPGISSRRMKLRGILLGLWDSFEGKAKAKERFPRLFEIGKPG